MAKIEIKGTLIFKSEPVKYSDKFTKAEVVIMDTTTKYPEYIKFEAINDKIDMLAGYKNGVQVTCEGFLGGKEYTKKDGTTGYITSIKLAKIYENIPAAPAVQDDAIPF